VLSDAFKVRSKADPNHFPDFLRKFCARFLSPYDFRFVDDMVMTRDFLSLRKVC